MDAIYNYINDFEYDPNFIPREGMSYLMDYIDKYQHECKVDSLEDILSFIQSSKNEMDKLKNELEKLKNEMDKLNVELEDKEDTIICLDKEVFEKQRDIDVLYFDIQNGILPEERNKRKCPMDLRDNDELI